MGTQNASQPAGTSMMVVQFIVGIVDGRVPIKGTPTVDYLYSDASASPQILIKVLN